MPELPEVETVKNILLPLVKNQTFARVEVFYPRMILSGSATFASSLVTQTIVDMSRIGKYLLFHISSDLVLISHLRMEGKFFLLEKDELPGKHSRVLFTFKSGRRISYDDSRMFGVMKLINKKDLATEPLLAKLGPEPFDIKTPDYLYKKFQRTSRAIKTIILDQSVISGLGNIYADEVLFSVKINPLTPANTLKIEDCQKIITASVKVLNKAIELGGSTVKSYHAARGVDGMFQDELLAYGRIGEKCPTCGYGFKKIFVGGRGTTFCPKCQRYHHHAKVIGITGKIASGKSTVLAICKEHGFAVISADEIVAELYKKPDIITALEKLMRHPLKNPDGTLNRLELTNIIQENLKAKHRLEAFIHPLVEEKLIDFITSTAFEYVAIEVPLLYEANLDYLCDKIIALDAAKVIQIANLRKRGCKDIEQALSLNSTSQFDSYKKKADYLLKTDGNLENLKKSVKSIINKL